MEQADVVYKLFQVSYRLRVRFLAISFITHLDHFGIDGVPDELSLNNTGISFRKKTPMVPVSI